MAETDDKGKQTSRRWTAFLIGASALTLIVCVLVGGRLWRIGIEGEWVWGWYEMPSYWLASVDCALVGVVLLALVWLGVGKKAKAKFTPLILIGILFAAFTLMQVTPGLSPHGVLEDVVATAVPWVGGYYSESLRVDSVPGYLRHYAEYIATLEVDDKELGHIADHPPGPVVLHWVANHGLRRRPGLTEFFYPGDDVHRFVEERSRRALKPSDTAGIGLAAMFFRLMAVLTVIPVYLLGRDLYGRRAGIAAAGLAVLIPSINCFSPYPDQMFPLCAATSMWLFVRGTRSDRYGWLWLFATGVVFFIGMQFTLAFLTVMFMMGAWAVLAFIAARLGGRKEGDGDPFKWVEFALSGALGIFLPALASAWFLDYDVVEVWTVCLSKHAGFAATFHRTYWKWALFGPVEIALFTGVPISCLVIRRAVRRALKMRPGSGNAKPPLDVFLWSLLVTSFVLNVSGKSLGEVARLWMFVMPFAAILAAAELCEDSKDRRLAERVAWTFALLFIQMIVFCASLNVFGITLETDPNHAQYHHESLHAPARTISRRQNLRQKASGQAAAETQEAQAPEVTLSPS